jgi:WD40 repeat protein
MDFPIYALRRQLGGRPGSRSRYPQANAGYSKRGLLANFYSRPYAIHRFSSASSTFVPPFAVQYSHHKCDGKLLAVSDEDGFVTLLDHRRDSRRDDQSYQNLVEEGESAKSFVQFASAISPSCHQYTGESMAKKKWCAHTNAIFDLSWNHNDNDETMITASGDQSIRLWNLDRLDQAVSVFRGHVGSVKTVSFKTRDPSKQNNSFSILPCDSLRHTSTPFRLLCFWLTRWEPDAVGLQAQCCRQRSVERAFNQTNTRAFQRAHECAAGAEA